MKGAGRPSAELPGAEHSRTTWRAGMSLCRSLSYWPTLHDASFFYRHLKRSTMILHLQISTAATISQESIRATNTSSSPSCSKYTKRTSFSPRQYRTVVKCSALLASFDTLLDASRRPTSLHHLLRTPPSSYPSLDMIA